MLLKHFVPLAILVIALICAGADRVGVPVPPVALITTFAAILLALQAEDHRLANFLGELAKAFKEGQRV